MSTPCVRGRGRGRVRVRGRGSPVHLPRGELLARDSHLGTAEIEDLEHVSFVILRGETQQPPAALQPAQRGLLRVRVRVRVRARARARGRVRVRVRVRVILKGGWTVHG